MARSRLLAMICCGGILVPGAAAKGEGPAFREDVKPLVDQFCLKCHGERKPKGGVDLSKFRDEAGSATAPDLWAKVAEALNERTMPPEGKPQPSEEARRKAVERIEAILRSAEAVKDPGPGPIQRLTREQYNNTIRDLLGVDSRPADAFPADGGGGGGFDNNAATLFVPPILMERYLAAATGAVEKADPSRYIAARPDPSKGISPGQAARECIAPFATRAFRRPVRAEEIDRYIRLYEKAEARNEPFEAAVRLAIRGILVSPNFLFLVEREQESEEPYRVDDFELATRLSYFLWSSMPDEELFRVAGENRLHEPGVIEGQVKRMLADPKSKALARSFAGQWLGIDSLKLSAEPDRGRFPSYNAGLRDAFIEEAVTTFHEILKGDAPLIDLVAADYVYINEDLARHYEIGGVTGPEFRRVQAPDPRRGGVLGMGAVLTLTSYPQRTSPVLRGKWVLEELLGTPPPPPPNNVKVLPPDDAPKDGQSFRQRLEQHRKDANCAACHAKLDPPGFGLENFDPIGRWRDEIGGQPVDSSGEMVGGKKFSGPAELKALLLADKKPQILRNVASRMLAYALRRGLEPYDSGTIKTIVSEVEAGGDRGQALVLAIVRSYPFQYRRNRPVAPTEARP